MAEDTDKQPGEEKVQFVTERNWQGFSGRPME
jgi:hypothetical protein